MDKETRNKLRNAVVQCRKLLEQDVLDQLEGTFGIHRQGRMEPESALPHLDDEGLEARRRAVAAVEHIQGYSIKPADAVDQFQREVAFTHLNRLCAFKTLERRGLLEETVSRGPNSNGFKVYLATHPDDERLWRTGSEYRAYKHFLFDVCARLSEEIKVLFDTEHVSSFLFPSQRTLGGVLDLINTESLSDIWDADETIGWIYQYFTPKELREKARKESAAPRNSYELAFRNQFYTPRYVVQFLTDNTLGRIWYEMRKGETRLVDECQYMVRRKRPVFMAPGEKEPEPFGPSDEWGDPDLPGEMWVRPNPDAEDISSIFRYALTVGGYDYARQYLGVECGDLANERLAKYHETKKWAGTFEELRCCLFFEQRRWRHFGTEPEGEEADAIKALHRAICDRWNLETEYIPHREKKLPWEIRVLDPACGSGHFLLYAFDLLETIYDEAHDDPALGEAVRERYPDRDAYHIAVPALILRHNLHGIDIDLRSVQISSLVLWIRAQRSYQRLGLNGEGRPRIERTNIVCAEPMPGQAELLEEFIADLRPRVLGQLVRMVFGEMELAGEAGSLLKIEQQMREAVAEAKRQWKAASQAEQLQLWPEMRRPKPEQLALFDVSDVTDEAFWDEAEGRVLEALEAYAERAADGQVYLRRLFAEDAAQGFAFVDLCGQHYDAILMNPPFGASPERVRDYLGERFVEGKSDVAAAMIQRALALLSANGLMGAITTRTLTVLPTFEPWRLDCLLLGHQLRAMADLGYGVLDDAMVEAAAYVVGRPISGQRPFLSCLNTANKEQRLGILIDRCSRAIATGDVHLHDPSTFSKMPASVVAYSVSTELAERVTGWPALESYGAVARKGLNTSDDERFLRTAWEVSPGCIGRNERWVFLAKGGEWSPFWDDIHLLVDWKGEGQPIAEAGGTIRNPSTYFISGLTYPERTTSSFGPRALPAECAFSTAGLAIHFPQERSPLCFLGLLLSRPGQFLIEMSLGGGDSSVSGTAARHYTNGMVNRLPFPPVPGTLETVLANLTSEAVILRRKTFEGDETSRVFAGFAPEDALGFSDVCAMWYERHLDDCAGMAAVVQALEDGAEDAFGFKDAQVKVTLTQILGPSPFSYAKTGHCRDEDVLDYQGVDEFGLMALIKAKSGAGARFVTKNCQLVDRRLELLTHLLEQPLGDTIAAVRKHGEVEQSSYQEAAATVLSYFLGTVFGRWDVRLALDPSLAPALADPFAPLPVCAPGMLVGPDGLPARPGGIVSEEWLRARPDAITLPPEGTVSRPTIADSEYPLRVDWDGILVDDPDHPEDIVRRVRDVLELLWRDQVPATEQEACEILGVKSLRDYFRNPKHFWDHHVKRYSKSRRKAPIYWLLQSPRRHYALWLYYHRLDRDMLYKALRNYVDPKYRLEESRLKELRDRLAGTPEGRERKALEKQIDDQETVVNDVLDFKERLEKVAALGLDPDLNDGVVLNIAPLHELVPWKEPKQYWDDLLADKYEWSTIGKQLREKGLVRG